mgnify:FL=1
MTAIQIDISEDISRLDIPSKADAKTLTLMRVGAMRGISFYISPRGPNVERDHERNIRDEHQRPDHASVIHRRNHRKGKRTTDLKGQAKKAAFDYCEQLRIRNILTMLDMNARGELTVFERRDLYAALDNERTRTALRID